MTSRIDCRFFVLAAVLATAFVAPAHAFTFENGSVANSDGSRSQIADPDRRFESGNSAGTIRQGNTTIQFGGSAQPSRGQQFDQSRERMLNPVARPGD